MSIESIPVPSERIPPVAADQASSSKVIAGVLFFAMVIIGFAMMGAMETGKGKRETITDSAERAGYDVGTVIAPLLIAGLPALFGFRSARNASRATRAGALAKTNPSYTWQLSGKYIIATDPAGAPHPELSFKVNGKLRTMLLAVPRAAVVDKT